MRKEKALLYRRLINKIIDALPDEEALEVTELFLPWVSDKEYSVDERVKFNDNLYACVQAHTSQDNWTPDLTPALWKRVSVEEWPEWIQPTGAQDAYMTGDKVSHNDKHWISLVDNNVWEPGGVGTESLWNEVIEN